MSESRSSSWIVYLILGALSASMAILFAFQNSEEILVKFMIWEWEAPLSVTYGIVIALAIIIVVLFGISHWFRRKRLQSRIRKLEKRVAELESNNDNEPIEYEQQDQNDDIELG